MAFGIQRANEVAVGIHNKGFSGEFGLLGGDLYIVHGMGHIGADAIGYGDREIYLLSQVAAQAAPPEFSGQEPQNLQRGDDHTAGAAFLDQAVDKIGVYIILEQPAELSYPLWILLRTVAREDLNNGRMVFVMSA